MWNSPSSNIHRSIPVDLVTDGDFTDENGFFIRSGAGNICYCPVGNSDAEAITKTVDAKAYFEDPELCRKIFQTGTTATGIYVGYGI